MFTIIRVNFIMKLIIMILTLIFINVSRADNFAYDYNATGFSFSTSTDDSLGNMGFGNLLGGGVLYKSVAGNNLSTPHPGSDLWNCQSVQPMCGVTEVAATDISRNRRGYGDSYFYEPGSPYQIQGETYYMTEALATSENGKTINIKLVHKISDVYGNCYLYNMNGGNYWNCLNNGGYKEVVNINYGMSSGGIKSLDISSANPCGTLQTCGYRYASWLGRLDMRIGVLVPQVLEGGTYYFRDVNIASLERGISSAGNTSPYRSNASYLKISGSITVPDRCYISINEQMLDFGKVTVEGEGFLGQKELTLRSGCVGVDKKIKMEISLSPLNDLSNNYVAKLLPRDGSDSNSTSYIGVVTKKTSVMADRCGNSDNTYLFNIFHTVDEISNATNGVPQNYSFKDFSVFFNLCYFGNGTLPSYGEYYGGLKLTTKFSF